MALEMGITLQALTRWVGRCEDERVAVRAGRPEVISAAARWKLRACYVGHYKQWGPRVLREWARRQGLGTWSATTIAAVIADLRDEPQEKPPTVRYEIMGSNVMWSEDGTGFKDRGRKKELVVAQDEHARFKVGYELVDGPADEDAVHRNLVAAFARYGAPLVLKHDGGSIFHGRRIRTLLQEHQVTELTGPRHYPQYNGKKERSMRDIKSFERAMRRHGRSSTLRQPDRCGRPRPEPGPSASGAGWTHCPRSLRAGPDPAPRPRRVHQGGESYRTATYTMRPRPVRNETALGEGPSNRYYWLTGS